MFFLNQSPPSCEDSAVTASLKEDVHAKFTQFSLGSWPWRVHNKNGTIDVEASIPGNVHTDLMKANILGDPLWRFNEQAYAWVAEEEWTYYTRFDASELQSHGLHEFQSVNLDDTYLTFDSIDTIASIRLNDFIVGTSNNMFQHQAFSVRNCTFLTTENVVTVTILPALAYTAEQAAEYPYVVPYIGTYGETWSGKQNRPFIRKVSSDFGWDWGPGFIPVGIYGNVQLVSFYIGRLAAVSVQQQHLDNGKVILLIDSNIDLVSRPAAAGLEISLEGMPPQQHPISLTVGENIVRAKIVIDRPRLWWPVGYGAPELYVLNVTLGAPLTDSGKRRSLSSSKLGEHTISRIIGLRRVELVRQAEPVASKWWSDEDGEAIGESFFFRVNGVDIFAKGSNIIPISVFTGAVTDEEMEWLLDSAVAANMNMLRVWGGGLYQPDSFYDMCDRKGLMIWQEFMFACAMYPTDNAFLASVSVEVTQQVRRLGTHPSVVVWGGNNENEAALTWFSETKSNPPRYDVDFTRLYIDTIWATLRRLLPEEPPVFVDSSPSNGILSEAPYTKRWGSVSDWNFGDVHFYDYTKDCELESTFPRSRFVSEFGYQRWTLPGARWRDGACA
eukprot:gene5921-7123_t